MQTETLKIHLRWQPLKEVCRFWLLAQIKYSLSERCRTQPKVVDRPRDTTVAGPEAALYTMSTNKMADSLATILSTLTITLSFLDLPAEIMQIICIQLDVKSLAVMARTSGKWRRYIKDNASIISSQCIERIIKDYRIEGLFDLENVH